MYNKNRETLEAYVLGDDFKYFQNLKYLPLSVYPSNIQSALVVYCFSGKAKLNVYDDSHWIQPQELIILLPGQFVSFTEASDDFGVAYNVQRCAERCASLFTAFLFLYEDPLLVSSDRK